MRLFINKLQTIQLGNISFQYKSIVASTFRSGLKYVFLEKLFKEKVIIEDSEENFELFVSSETVKFTPKYPSEYEGTDSSPKIYNALLTKKPDTDNWMTIIEIEGFDFEEGYEYLIDIKKITQAEPYLVRYLLLDIKSKTLKD